MTQQKHYKGFTLIELMVVMALMAVLAVLVLGAVQLARNTATETIHRSNAKAVQTALESDYARNKTYCSTTQPTPAGRLQCGTDYSLNEVYKRFSNDADLAEMGGCSSSTYKAGGGVVKVNETDGYFIKVAKADCLNFTGDGDDIKSNSANTDAPAWPSN